MKFAALFLTLVTSQLSFAALTNSSYELRHQDLIQNAIEKNCGHMRDLSVVESKEEIIRVDQGITDVNYVTVLTGQQRMDQNIFDTYTITVTSEYADMYDHASKEWGAYFVSSVKCIMQ